MHEFRPLVDLEARQLMTDRLADGRRTHPRSPSRTRRRRLARQLRNAADRLDG